MTLTNDDLYYKAVRLDKTSHYDKVTKWHKGRIVRPDRVDESDKPCGHGIHISPRLLGAVRWQAGPSIYAVVEPVGRILGRDETKCRCEAVRCVRWLTPEETDKLAGFRLWEANHPHHPFKHRTHYRLTKRQLRKQLAEWSLVRDSVGASVRASVGASVYASVYDSVRASVCDSVGASVYAYVYASVGASVYAYVYASAYAYVGSLFPHIREWEYTDKRNPWAPLAKLWYAGYVPSFDGTVWRLHKGRRAKVVLEWEPKR